MEKLKAKYIDSAMATDSELASAVFSLQSKIAGAFPFNPVKTNLLVDENRQMLVYQELKIDSGELNIKGEVVVL